MTITIDKIDEYHLGQLFMLFEGATAFLGEFFDINAFNQPGVELAKDLTKEKLE
ncbi:MAG: glucose-6-phosphate isomerase [Candidatus Paceibacteria bacterium]